MDRRRFLISSASMIGAGIFASVALPAETNDRTNRRAALNQQLSTVQLDVKNHGGVISPLLFGHNLEITRRGIWSGLSAEMVANRKFAAVENNQPKRWTVVGGEGAARIETSFGYAGHQCLRVEVPADGSPTGIKQQHEVLAVHTRKPYSVRVWVRSEAARVLRVCLTDGAHEVYLEKTATCKSGDWQLVSAEFTAHDTQENCELKITSSTPGSYWLGAVSLQPKDAFHGMRRDVVALLKKMKPGCLRFPGGCYEEFYSWEDGLLPVDQRPPIGPTGLWFLLTDTDDYDTHEIGIDEFMAVCREVGAEPAITVRMSEKTPESAAAWVEYCNGDKSTKWGQLRIERGYRVPYHVRWWFVGNEMFAFGRGEVLKADGYSAQCRLFSEAMKNADDSIYLVPCTQFSNGVAWPDWNTPVMESAKDTMRAGSAHQYMLDQIPLVTEADYAKVINTPRGSVVDTLKLARELMDKYQPEDRRLGLVYDEWNLMWGRKGSVPAALYVAGILNMLCREAQPLGLEMACYFMPVNEGAIKVTPLAAEFDTTGHVFELYKIHQGNRLLEVAGTPTVDLCASLSPDGKRVTVTAVNGITAEQIVTLTLPAEAMTNARVVHLVPKSLEITETELIRTEERVSIKQGRLTVLMAPGEIARITVDIA